MKRALSGVVIAWLVLSGCDEPCKPGYAKKGWDCKKLPVDGGVDGGGDPQSANGAMDGGVGECLPPTCDPCDAKPCENGGACETTARGFACTCAIGFSGARCQTDPCELDPCLNGGVCKRTKSGRACSCAADWTGDSCEIGTNAKVVSIVPSAGALFPAFTASTLEYSLDLGIGDAELTLTVHAAQPDGVRLQVGDEPVTSGVPSSALRLELNGSVPQRMLVRSAADNGSETSYTITVRRTLKQQAYVKRAYEGAINFGGDTPGYQDGQMLSLRGDALALSDSHRDGDKGAVYLFSRNAGTWGVARVFESDVPGARLGSAVLLTDDLLVMGASVSDEVRVYERRDLIGAGPEFDTLTVPAGSPAIAQFGKALASDGDTLFVGAPGGGERAPVEVQPWGGEVHVFQRDGQGWAWKQVISSPIDPNAGRFGARIAAEGGVLVVGDPNAGSVYVYRKDGQTWVSDGKLNLDDDALGLTAIGGGAVGISNGRVAVAEIYVGIFAGFLGEPRLSVFDRSGGSWTRTGTVLLPRDPEVPNDSAPAGFGMTGLSFHGRTVVVGAQYAPGFGAGVSTTINYGQAGVASPGAAYVFSETAQGWALSAHLKASNPGVGDNFGSRVTLDGNTVVVSAASEDSKATGIDGDQTDDGASDSGAVYIFSLDCQQLPTGATVPGC